MTIFELLIIMVFAHVLADWTLQTPIQANNKWKYPYIMAVHCFIWAVAIFVPLMIMGYHINFYLFVAMYFIHWIVDDWKCYIVWQQHDEKGNPKEWNADAFKIWHLYVDQGIHLAQIVVLWAFYTLT